MQVTSIQPNAQPAPLTAPLPAEAPAVACEKTACLAKDALVQSTEAPAPEAPAAAPAESIFDWAINWFNITFLSSFRPFFLYSRDEEDEEETRAANLERQGAERRLCQRRRADMSLQEHLRESLSTVKAVDEARKFHQAVEQLTRKPQEARA